MSTYNHDNHDCRERVILEEYEKLSPDLIFEIIRHDGEEELERKTKPLILSGLAAGIIISFSFYFKAILAMYVGHTLWAEAISGFGYTTVSSWLSWDGSSCLRKIPSPRCFLL